MAQNNQLKERQDMKNEREIQVLLANKMLIPTQKETLKAFEKYQRGEEQLASGTRLAYLHTLRDLAISKPWGWHKSFQSLTKEHLIGYMEHLWQQVKRGTKAEATFRNKSRYIRRFLKWLHDSEDREFPKEFESKIWKVSLASSKTPRGRGPVRRKDIITVDEIQLLMKYAGDTKSNAQIALLIDGGPRAQREFLAMRIQDAWRTINEDGTELETFTVRFHDREVDVYDCLYWLQLWLDNHPDKDNPDAPLWPAEQNPDEPMGYQTFKSKLDRWLELSGIAERRKKAGLKPITPHLFRHTAATLWAGKPGMNEYALCQRFGWEQGSRMASVYVHLANADDVRNHVRIAYGLEPKDRMEAKRLLDYIQVPRDTYKQLEANHDNLKDRVEELETEDRELKTKISMVRDLLMAEGKDPDQLIAEAIRAMQEVEPGEYKKTTIELSDKAIYKILLRALAKR